MKIATIGLDLAETPFQIHGANLRDIENAGNCDRDTRSAADRWNRIIRHGHRVRNYEFTVT
ncbi:hypothetical protein FVF58_06855 [Paraburkholderia panacisoli]|uniref:Uncharacterized protein n=1 Tax=Paraburkholderia panacisoli TaxID=2603818 RepID=A0A5B0HGU3_9BURK|nr:hypothetical protein [Paraburkholderia panacisoli]KAA1014539.1 hypothetical protein FVF58_06855 [Paraburkholderia panacisoli]